MDLDTVVITVFISLMGGGLGTLFWSRLNKIEGIMGTMATRHDIEQLHEEIVHLRSEQAVMRSDLTHVALAVGARPGHASQS